MTGRSQIGRYKILEELGRGAMGRVLRAEDPTIGRQVAIKVISLTGSSEENTTFERSFLREIRSTGALHHPGIVAIFDACREDDFAYIVMELVDGVTFDAMLSREPRPDAGTLLGVCRQVGAALDYAHARGVVHRDIKPANILIAANGTARIADFGIAKIPRQGGTISGGHTIVGAGTPAYMSPEQVEGKALDGRSDQWALAVMAYNALAGSPPFRADQMFAVLAQIVGVDPQPATRMNPSLPAAVDAVLARALAKDPALRYASCGEFMQELDQAYGVAAQPAAAPPAAAPPSPAEEVARPTTARSRFRMVQSAAGLVLAAAILLLLLRRHEPAAQPAAAPPVQPPATVSAAPAPQIQTHSAAREAPQAAPPKPAVIAPASKKVWPVHVATTPPGAILTADGKSDSTCTTPCALDLTEGAHSIAVRKDGFRPRIESIQAGGGEPELAYTLQAITGSLMINTQPAGAAIAIDGKPRAEVTPATLALPPGRYHVRLTRSGADPYEFDTEVPADTVREVSVTLGGPGA